MSTISRSDYRTLVDRMRPILEARRHEILQRQRGDLHVERVADQQEHAEMVARNERTAREISRDAREIRAVDAALRRINEGTYGVCFRCDHAIPRKRLDAVPWADCCTHCQEVLDAQDRLETETVVVMSSRQ